MERSGFIFYIREAREVLHKKKIELFKGLGGNEIFDNVEQGKEIIARHLRSIRVVIVMDDVDHVDQLDSLLPAKDNFRRGGLITVTTRECDVLTSWDMSSIYKMRVVDPFNATQLFCWHSLLQPLSLDGFEELVEKFVKEKNRIRGIKATSTEIEKKLSYKEVRTPNISEKNLLLAPYLVGVNLLEIGGDYFSQINWSNIGQRNLPRRLSLESLRVLQLNEDYEEEHHLEELWEAESDVSSLPFLLY
ncbi:hypothetical protein SUGI_1128440 [Cryptomeria japonica]|nr:hypothetical protein SUGI_1128440 [Cryptomeria japonica]